MTTGRKTHTTRTNPKSETVEDLRPGEYATLERTLARRYGYDPNQPDTLTRAVTRWQHTNGAEETGVWDEASAQRWRETRHLQARINSTRGPVVAEDGDHGPVTTTNMGRVL